MGDCARLEMPEAQLPQLLSQRENILRILKKDYKKVLLDLEVRHEQ